MALARAGRLGAVTLCYVDHRLRPDSAADGELVARLAEAGGAGFAAEVVEVGRRGASPEEAAREARYAALERVAARMGGAAVLTGHTADDQAETVLMRILAGTGLTGLAGIPERRGRFVRPLLAASRADTAAYCQRHGIATAEDPSNRDPRHRRNRVRHQILPLLRGENPRVDRALVALAERAAEVNEVARAAADELAAAAERGGVWDAAALAAAPRLVSACALARAVADAGGGPLSARHHAALDALCHRAAGGSASLDLPRVRALCEYGRLSFTPRGRERGGAGDAAGDIEVTGPDGPYEVRSVRAGDRMQPARLRGRSRKLSDLFIDARVPRRLRAAARVVVRAGDGRIEWAEHIGPAHGSRAQVTLTGQVALATNKTR
jgi:tRNA(Ile)-lysidine synthase